MHHDWVYRGIDLRNNEPQHSFPSVKKTKRRFYFKIWQSKILVASLYLYQIGYSNLFCTEITKGCLVKRNSCVSTITVLWLYTIPAKWLVHHPYGKQEHCAFIRNDQWISERNMHISPKINRSGLGSLKQHYNSQMLSADLFEQLDRAFQEWHLRMRVVNLINCELSRKLVPLRRWCKRPIAESIDD